MIYIILAFVIGISIVTNMIMNGRFCQESGMLNSIFFNYSVAAVSSLLLCAVMLRTVPSYGALSAVPLPYYMGGFIGVLTTYLFNLIITKVPAVYIVLLRFIGQMLTSALLDWIYLGVFSKGKLIGGILFFIGLVINTKADRKKEEAIYEI
jgi:uncharacterized membrane protein YdcZ (DUF606 family)